MSTSDRKRPSRSGQHIDQSTWDAMMAAGFSQEELEADQPMGPVLYSYSRAQAIAEGQLIDLMVPPFSKLVRDAGIAADVAMTHWCHVEVLHPLEGGYPEGQSPTTRLRDVLTTFMSALRRQQAKGVQSNRVHFCVKIQ